MAVFSALAVPAQPVMPQLAGNLAAAFLANL